MTGEVFEEWRVTGTPGDPYPPYNFVWSALRNRRLGDPRAEAVRFMQIVAPGSWVDGPHLSRRIVVHGQWEPVDVGTACGDLIEVIHGRPVNPAYLMEAIRRANMVGPLREHDVDAAMWRSMSLEVRLLAFSAAAGA